MTIPWNLEQLRARGEQLLEDLQLASEGAIALDTAIGGSVGLPDGEYGTWRNVARSMAHPDVTPPSHKARLAAELAALDGSSGDLDEKLATLRYSALWAYQDLHAHLPAVDPFISHTDDVSTVAKGLRHRLTDAEDEALRVATGAGDVRRNARRE